MNKLALKLPGEPVDYEITSPTPQFNTLGDFLSGLFNIVILTIGVLLISWLSWGIFQYIFASGNKENLAKARARITWALIGFILVLASFALSQYLQTIFEPNLTKEVTPVITPTP